MTSEQIFFAAIIGLQNFFSGHVPSKFLVMFFGRGGGGLKLDLYVFLHNNNFNLINIYSVKTLMFCFAIFFFTKLRVQIFLCPFGTLQIFFTNSSTPPPPPPPPRDQLVRP